MWEKKIKNIYILSIITYLHYYINLLSDFISFANSYSYLLSSCSPSCKWKRARFRFYILFHNHLENVLNFNLYKNKRNVSSCETPEQNSRNPFQGKPNWNHYRFADVFLFAISSEVTVGSQQTLELDNTYQMAIMFSCM